MDQLPRHLIQRICLRVQARLCGDLEIESLAQGAQQGGHASATVAQNFANQQVNRLDFVGAFVNHADPRVAHDLLNASFAHKPMAAKHLQAIAAAVKRLGGPGRLEYRRDQAAPALGADNAKLLGKKKLS